MAEPHASGPAPAHEGLSLPKTFDPASVEARIYQGWVDGGYFGADPAQVAEGGDPYVIVIPPPNVTAVLHMGHGLNNTVQDVLIRWRRMQGRVALWVPGTDHAGIATQNVVERQLTAEGTCREALGRDAFVERVWSFVHTTGNQILEQLKAIGCSCDWNRTRFTLDEGLSRAVREVFVRLHEEGLIYRGEYIINWCPRCLTALSNEEAEGSEADGSLWHLRYPIPDEYVDRAEAAAAAGADAISRLEDGRWALTVSTTRPETMLGDTGVAVNPNDPRYSALVGAEAKLPLTERWIPIVADEYVDAEFGTGMVKVTPAHDPNDFDIAARTGLAVLNVMTPEAAMNDEVPEAYRGLDRADARKAVLRDLESQGLLAGRDDHRHTIPRCYRCDTVVEPRLSEQWFVRMGPMAEKALAASRDGTVTFTPGRWTKVYDQWMENIRDWCISRQLWWGHRIPVWYCDGCGERMVLREDPTECASCGSKELQQDPDVLDTWFSSWLWPMSVFGWPEETEDLAAFYPGHSLVTAPEILFFWVARMIMSGLQMRGEVPFTQVYLHGTVRDIQGRKMSKSLGNGIDPLDVVSLYGADALRYTLMSNLGVGADIRLDHEDVEASFAPGRNFVNKLWNAGRFALSSLGAEPVAPLDAVTDDLALEDRWMLSRLRYAEEKVDAELEALRLHGAAEALREVFWSELADWYLEFVKSRLREDADPASRTAARSVLAHALDRVCRLLHPLVPFVTEELWGKLPSAGEKPEALIIASWPTPDPAHDDPEAEARFAWLQDLIVQVRSLRKEYGAKEGQRIHIHVDCDSGGRAALEEGREALERLARIGSVDFGSAPEGAAGATAVLTDGTQVFIPLEGLIDLDQELARLAKEIERLQGQLAGTRGKLENEAFVSRAPEAVVNKEREKEASLLEQISKLEEKRDALSG